MQSHHWLYMCVFFFSSRRRHTRCSRDWSSDVCSSDLVEHRVLEGTGEMRPVAVQIVARPHGAQHRSLQTRERELVALVPHRARKREATGIALAREPLDRGAARIAQAEQRGHLVERLPGGIIAGRAE